MSARSRKLAAAQRHSATEDMLASDLAESLPGIWHCGFWRLAEDVEALHFGVLVESEVQHDLAIRQPSAVGTWRLVAAEIEVASADSQSAHRG